MASNDAQRAAARSGGAGGVGRFVWNPAGSDTELAEACRDLSVGRMAAAKRVLVESRGDPELRASRSLVLGAFCVESDVVESWLREEPDSADALLLFSRVAAARVLRAQKDNAAEAGRITRIAQQACLDAINADQNDATPFTVLMSLAHLGYPEPVPSGIPGLEVDGPWDLLDQVLKRNPVAREAHHRFLGCVSARNGGSHLRMWDFAWWAAARAPWESPLKLLPLAARAEWYSTEATGPDRVPMAQAQWAEQSAVDEAVRVHAYWFTKYGRKARRVPVADLSLLAYALYHGGKVSQAADVLRAMRPYAHRWPWSVDGEPAEQLTYAYTKCGMPFPR
ncbi:MAG TPA: hypothetical protein VGX23_25490 [Actinocrinis sp.]|nr:hypothetical protein [Actinocrinis sp.]